MSLLLLEENLSVSELGDIASGEAIGEPTLTQQTLAGQSGVVIWPWPWTRNPRDIIRPPQLPEPEPEEELLRVTAMGDIPSGEVVGTPSCGLRTVDLGGIASEEDIGELTVKVRRLRLVRRAEEMALLIWRKAA